MEEGKAYQSTVNIDGVLCVVDKDGKYVPAPKPEENEPVIKKLDVPAKSKKTPDDEVNP